MTDTLPYLTYFRGYPCCPCLKRWLPWFEKELLRRKLIVNNIDIYQLIGNAPASAGTHSKGGAFDIKQFTQAQVRCARDMGADATWHRAPPTFSPEHAHGVLRGCPHNSPVRYQIAAVDDGYNGLGVNGHGGPDDGPRPLSYRTWKEGIAYAKAQTPPTRLEQARELLEVIRDNSKTAVRKAKFTKILDLLPKK